jgi:hypothetical protein
MLIEIEQARDQAVVNREMAEAGNKAKTDAKPGQGDRGDHKAS